MFSLPELPLLPRTPAAGGCTQIPSLPKREGTFPARHGLGPTTFDSSVTLPSGIHVASSGEGAGMVPGRGEEESMAKECRIGAWVCALANGKRRRNVAGGESIRSFMKQTFSRLKGTARGRPHSPRPA